MGLLWVPMTGAWKLHPLALETHGRHGRDALEHLRLLAKNVRELGGLEKLKIEKSVLKKRKKINSFN